MKVQILFLMMAVLNTLCSAQSDSLLTGAEQTIESLIEETDEESDNADLYDIIQNNIDNPVNLNKASLEDLSVLPYLDLATANLIVEHRNKYGNFFSTNELYSIPGISEKVIEKILPFISTKENPDTNKTSLKINSGSIAFKFRSRLLQDLQPRKGFRDYKYTGSSLKVYNRFKLNYSDNLEMGFLADKDAGEISYYDFYSGYINISGWHGLKNLIIGDYLIKFGQGLSIWSPYGLSKGSDAIYSVKKKSSILHPYSSSTENNFFRGAAIEFGWEHASITGFYSLNFVDAGIDSTIGIITSTPVDGFHRTKSEILKRKSVLETSTGISANLGFSEFLSFGFLYYHSKFDHPFYKSDIYDINGDSFKYYSSYIDLFINNFNLFGELSFNRKSIASISGLQFSPISEFSYTLLIRNYPKNYISLHGYGFGERSGACSNEFGIYNGLRWRSVLGVINFYFDQFKFPFASYTNPLPSQGNEFMLHHSSKPLEKLTINSRVKIENKEVAQLWGDKNRVVKRLKQSFRIEFIFNLSRFLRIKTRMEYSNFYIKDPPVSEDGYLVFNDLMIQPVNKLLIYSRIIFFWTDSFNSVIYEYENDLTGILSNAGLYGEGVRFYFVLKYKLLKKLSLSFKYSETYKPKATSIGTGYQEIDGNMDNRVGFQLDFNF